MKKLRSRLLRFTSLVPFLMLSGCGGGGGFGASGSLTLGVTDAPVDGVTQVVITFSEVQVHASGGDTRRFILSSPQQIDLLALRNGQQTLLLDHQSLDAGDYEWVRLFIDEAASYVTTSSGAQLPLRIPSNAQTGLKINRSFTLAQNGVASFVIDFDLRKSLHLPQAANQPYLLRPTLRMVEASTTSAIAGTVDAARVAATGCADFTATSGATGGAVYVYSGTGATPVDIDNTQSAGQPVTVAPVAQDGNGAWVYTAAFLPAGAYTVAFTCQATQDLPDSDESMVFQDSANVTVASGITATHDFP